MNNYMSTLWQVIGIIFLITLTLFLFSLLIEYVKMLWARHKFEKEMKRSLKISPKDADEIEKILTRALNENGKNGTFKIEEELIVNKDEKDD